MSAEISAEDVLFSEPRPGVLLIQLNRPEKLNAFSNESWELISSALSDAEINDDIRCIVFAGSDKAFAAGSDLTQMLDRGMFTEVAKKRFRHWDIIHRFPKPMIAAVNGYAVGGGCELALVCDIVVAGESASFGLPEINLGLIPGLGGTQRFVRAVGKSVAMKLILTGERIDAEYAHSLGLAAEVVDPAETLNRALELAEKIATKSPLAIQHAKQAVLQSFETGLEAGLANERRATVLLFASEDMKEGVSAFLEKRDATFKGR